MSCSLTDPNHFETHTNTNNTQDTRAIVQGMQEEKSGHSCERKEREKREDRKEAEGVRSTDAQPRSNEQRTSGDRYRNTKTQTAVKQTYKDRKIEQEEKKRRSTGESDRATTKLES